MDRKIISIVEFNRLQSIAGTSAIIISELKYYFILASIVQQYINDPSGDNFNKLQDAFRLCHNRFDNLHTIFQQLIKLLTINGNIKMPTIDIKNAEVEPLSEIVEQVDLVENTSPNIIQLFPTK